MTFKLTLALQGQLREQLLAEQARQEGAVTLAARQAGDLVKAIWRRDLRAARLSQKLANTIRADVFPKRGASLRPAVTVYTKAAKILAGMAEPMTIRGTGGNWLAIPTENAPIRLMGKRVTPEIYERRYGAGRLAFIPLVPGRSGILVDNDVRRRGGRRGGFAVRTERSRQAAESAAMFILVREVRTKRRFSLRAYEARGTAALARFAVRNLEAGDDAIAVAGQRQSQRRRTRSAFRRLRRRAR